MAQRITRGIDMALMNPQVNNNGTSRQELVNQRISFDCALQIAMERLNEMKPHGRDYIGKDHQYSLDRAVYQERFAILDKLRNENMDEALAIKEGK